MGKNNYDILHYAGHADFDATDPEGRAGWLFGEKLFTSRELGGVDRVPALIVANACLSAVTSEARLNGAGQSRLRSPDDYLLPGLADEFFKRGVRNYLGTAWEVNDQGAIMFANAFYDRSYRSKASLWACRCCAHARHSNSTRINTARSGRRISTTATRPSYFGRQLPLLPGQLQVRPQKSGASGGLRA